MNRINDFVDSFIPKNLPKKKAKALKEELTCHLLDKADHYMEISYEMSISMDKAIEEFGTDEDMKGYIRKEFEELYHERTIWGVLAVFFIFVLNNLSFFLLHWANIHDRVTEPGDVFISFLMLFSVLGLVAFARIKKYRKILLFIGISNITMWAFYQQTFVHSLLKGIIYLVDSYTPFLLGYTLTDGVLCALFCAAFSLILSFYCLFVSHRLKKGVSRAVKNPLKRCLSVGSVLFAVCVLTCSLHTDGREYIDNYPVFFSPYDLNITEKTGEIYDKINIGDTVEQAEEIMGRYVMQSIETHRGFLNELSRKQFDNQLARMDFHEDYTIYFTSFVHIKGNGFAGIKSENGIVTGVAVGNITEDMFNEKSHTFGYSNSGTWKTWDDLNLAKEFVSGLKPGDKEEDIITCFGDDSGLLGEDIGLVYSQRKYLEDGAYKTYYRVYFYGETVQNLEEFEAYYLELYFTDGILEKGTLYTKEYTDTEMIPKKIMTIG